jgi:hypothetical protein
MVGLFDTKLRLGLKNKYNEDFFLKHKNNLAIIALSQHTSDSPRMPY